MNLYLKQIAFIFLALCFLQSPNSFAHIEEHQGPPFIFWTDEPNTHFRCEQLVHSDGSIAFTKISGEFEISFFDRGIFVNKGRPNIFKSADSQLVPWNRTYGRTFFGNYNWHEMPMVKILFITNSGPNELNFFLAVADSSLEYDPEASFTGPPLFAKSLCHKVH